MKNAIAFRLNGESAGSEGAATGVVVDWLRRERGLTGTKEGCREGDCGACLVLLGGSPAPDGDAASSDEVEWLAVPSCLLALGELDGRHLVTIEGLAAAGPTPVVRALHGEGASQCGFCSPGVVVALTAFLLGPGPHDAAAAMAAVDGNLCRCTGYTAIRRAAASLAADFADLPSHFPARLASLAAAGVVPPALAAAMCEKAEKADDAGTETVQGEAAARDAAPLFLGGGTDYFVRNPDPSSTFAAVFSDQDGALRRIQRIEDNLEIGAAVTVREFFASPLVRAAVPAIASYERLVASTPIRSRATLAGNIANASPVGDLTAMIIALGGRLRLRGKAGWRELPLERFFLAYKSIDLRLDESIEAIVFRAPRDIDSLRGTRFFSFEKASKRVNLDIASVNSALSCTVENGPGPVLHGVRLSAGGVGPIPLFLAEASDFLEGKRPDAGTVLRAAELAVTSCAPQSDVRGSAAYRSALVKRFVYAHFIRLAPDSGLAEELFP